jgi:hypothetical protein
MHKVEAQVAAFESAAETMDTECVNAYVLSASVSNEAYAALVQNARQFLRNLVLQDCNVLISISKDYLQGVLNKEISSVQAQLQSDDNQFQPPHVSCSYKAPDCPTILGPSILFLDEFGIELDFVIAGAQYGVTSAFNLQYTGGAMQCDSSQSALACLSDDSEATIRRKLTSAFNEQLAKKLPVQVPLASDINSIGASISGVVILNETSIVGRLDPPAAFADSFPKNSHVGDIGAYQMPPNCDVELCLFEDGLLGLVKSKMGTLASQLSQPDLPMSIDLGGRLSFDPGSSAVSVTIAWHTNYADSLDAGIGKIDWNVDVDGTSIVKCEFWTQDTTDGVSVNVTCTPVGKPKLGGYKLHPESVDFVGKIIDFVSGAVNDVVKTTVEEIDFGEQSFKVTDINNVRARGTRVASKFVGLAVSFMQ